MPCGCGHSLGWVDREAIGPLQRHFLECGLSLEKTIRQHWRAAMKTALAAATKDLVVVEAIVACWSSRADGAMHTAATDQANGWKPPAMTAVNADEGYELPAVASTRPLARRLTGDVRRTLRDQRTRAM